MTLQAILGYAAALLLLASFAMKTIVWLRYLAVAGSAVLVAYALVAGHYPVLAIAAVMLAVNLWRLVEMQRMVGAVKAATAGAAAPLSVDWLLPHMQPVKAAKGEVIFRKGDAAEAMYFLASGRVRFDELGVEIGHGNLFGEIGVLSLDQTRSATATALEDCGLLKIAAEKMRELYYQNPDFGFFLVGVITRRLMEDLARAQGRPGKASGSG